MRVYLDTCCLNRPFDDQTQERVRLEAEAVRTIFFLFEVKGWEWVSSDIVALEVARTIDLSQRTQVESLLRRCALIVRADDATRQRGRMLEALGFAAFDALHLACAEQASADILLTTDDRFLRGARRIAEQLRVRVANPVTWLGEEFTREE